MNITWLPWSIVQKMVAPVLVAVGVWLTQRNLIDAASWTNISGGILTAIGFWWNGRDGTRTQLLTQVASIPEVQNVVLRDNAEKLAQAVPSPKVQTDANTNNT